VRGLIELISNGDGIWRWTPQDLNLDAEGMGDIVILSRKFVNKNGGDEQGAHGARLGLSYNELRREIGERMPTDGIRCMTSFWEIKWSKWENNSLNWFLNEFGITFVLKSKRNGSYNWWGMGGRDTAIAMVVT
jgi:hypothetical protein